MPIKYQRMCFSIHKKCLNTVVHKNITIVITGDTAINKYEKKCESVAFSIFQYKTIDSQLLPFTNRSNDQSCGDKFVGSQCILFFMGVFVHDKISYRLSHLTHNRKVRELNNLLS